MWPPSVEAVAAVFRGAGVEARLEELAPGETAFPGPAIRADAFSCDGRLLVALVPAERATDRRKLGCSVAEPIDAPAFPYAGATVLLDRSLLGEASVWIEAGATRYAAAVSPAHLARLARAQILDLVADE